MKSSLVFVASLALLAGCGSDKASGPTGLVGQMTFTYSGALSGTFNVTGQMPTTGQETSSWSAGEIVSTGTDAGAYVAGSTPRSSTTHDLVFVTANRTNAGTATIDYDTCTANVCSTVFFFFGLSNSGTFAFLQDCYLQTGTITITEVTSTRMKGTFSGAGLCFSQSGTETAFTVTNGSFDVALVPGVS